jgi:hypothetical protein
MSLHKLLFLLPISLMGLDRLPWFCNLWEFTFTPTYTYSEYPSIQNGVPHHQQTSHDHVLAFDLAVPPTPNLQIETEVEFADTPRQSMGLRSLAFQARYLWLDDLLGDPVSFTTGAVIRGVSRHSVKDVSCPYHSYLNFELNSAVGCEWNHSFEWRFRTFGGASIGIANHGYPWLSAFAIIEGQMFHAHRLGLLLDGYMGFGPHKDVFIDHFNGYASIEHRNIDAGLKYTYVFEVWGQLSLAYTRRLYARSFPEKVNFFTISYMLPFSLF